jgi:hypothetical protein
MLSTSSLSRMRPANTSESDRRYEIMIFDKGSSSWPLILESQLVLTRTLENLNREVRSTPWGFPQTAGTDQKVRRDFETEAPAIRKLMTKVELDRLYDR